MNIPLPFSLLGADAKEGRRVVMPAYWWMYNLYALERNSYKYRKRDKRKVIRQQIETDYLAPDTVNEIFFAACDLLCEWWGLITTGPVPLYRNEVPLSAKVVV